MFDRLTDFLYTYEDELIFILLSVVFVFTVCRM